MSPFLPQEFIQLVFKHFKRMQYPVARISHFHCALYEGIDNLCQRRCLCVITLDVIFRSQGSPMFPDIKGVRAVLGYSSLFIPAFLPEPGCLTMDQSPVVLSTVQTQKVSPVREQRTSMSTGLLVGIAPKAVQKSSAAKKALQKMGVIICSRSPNRVRNKPGDFPLHQPSLSPQRDHSYSE